MSIAIEGYVISQIVIVVNEIMRGDRVKNIYAGIFKDSMDFM